MRCVTAIVVGIALLGVSVNAQPGTSEQERDALLARAKVWHPIDTASLDLKAGPPGPQAFQPAETISCDYVDKKLRGGSPKFACRLSSGDVIKVKYGGDNGEVYAEVAASRLLWALGFGADRMYSVRVICRGCPDKVGGIVRDNGERIVDPAAVERPLGRELSDRWSWSELDQVDEAAGGATRAERDALKLLAVVLQHTDNKAIQQRIVCEDEAADASQPCAEPMMMISDLGLTFGRANALNKQSRGSVNLKQWAPLPVWKDAQKCVGNLSGSWTGTLAEPVISEEGRQFLADLLTALSDEQLRAMFEAARLNLRPREPDSSHSDFSTIDEWVQAFKEKRAQIVERQCAS